MSRWERHLSTLLTGVGLLLAVVVVRREFIVTEANSAPVDPRSQWHYVAAWQDVLSAARSEGPEDAPLHIIEFSDLECPFCRRFHKTLPELLNGARGKVRYSFVHFPLATHRHAESAAHAAECAGRQGRFVEFVNAVFDAQDSLSTIPMPKFAERAVVRDSEAFTACLRDSTALAPVNLGRQIGERLGVRGTPTVYLNGWRTPTVGRDSALASAIAAVLAGKDPFTGGSRFEKERERERP
jgi:predicted DsbA family dithiol-disulfide isomerase